MLVIYTVCVVDFSIQLTNNANVDWFYKEFGKKLKNARETGGLTQDALAKRVKLSRVSITNIERGVQHFPAHMLVVLAKAVGVDLISLLPIQPAAAYISQDLLDEVSPGTQGWINKIMAVAEAKPQKGKNAQERRSSKEDPH